MVDLMKWCEWHREEMSELMVTFVYAYFLNFFLLLLITSKNIIFPSPVMEISNTSVTWAGVAF